jgi:hypothetical protein
LSDIFQTRYEARRVFLEIEFMRRTNHRNVVGLVGLDAPASEDAVAERYEKEEEEVFWRK